MIRSSLGQLVIPVDSVTRLSWARHGTTQHQADRKNSFHFLSILTLDYLVNYGQQLVSMCWSTFLGTLIHAQVSTIINCIPNKSNNFYQISLASPSFNGAGQYSYLIHRFLHYNESALTQPDTESGHHWHRCQLWPGGNIMLASG